MNLIDDKKKITLLVIILGSITAIGPIAIDTYLPAFSEINRDFGGNNAAAQLSLTSYFLGLAIAQLFYGPVIDKYGKKIPLLFGITLFIITSVLCYYAKTIEELITLRFFQAIGTCACFVVPRAIVRDLFKPLDTAKVFSYLILIMGILPIIAPLIGSFILEFFHWRAIFLFFAIFGIILFIFSAFLLPEGKPPIKNHKISKAFRVYKDILLDKQFLFCSISCGMLMGGLFSFLVGSPYVYLDYFELSPKEYSYFFGANACAFVLFAQFNPRLLKKYSMENILSKALYLPVIAAIIMIVSGIFYANFWVITFAFFLYLGSVGVINPNLHALALANQGKYTGSASALLGTIQFTISVTASILINQLHNETTMPLTIAIGSCGILCYFFYNFKDKQVS